MFTTTGLANRLGVSTSTVTNWTQRSRDPLACSGAGRERRIDWDDFVVFASKHPSLRGVARQATSTADGQRPELASTLQTLERVLQQVESVIEDAKRTGEASKGLRRQIRQVVRSLEGVG